MLQVYVVFGLALGLDPLAVVPLHTLAPLIMVDIISAVALGRKCSVFGLPFLSGAKLKI